MKRTKLLIRTTILLLLVILMFSSSSLNTVDAKKFDLENERLFTETITLTNKKTKVDVGFVRVIFEKNCLPEEMYPITFEIEVYAEDGKMYIEFSPDVEDFLNDVKIKVQPFEGFVYDVATDEYIYVDIEKTVFKVPHFSRWCFYW